MRIEMRDLPAVVEVADQVVTSSTPLHTVNAEQLAGLFAGGAKLLVLADGRLGVMTPGGNIFAYDKSADLIAAFHGDALAALAELQTQLVTSASGTEVDDTDAADGSSNGATADNDGGPNGRNVPDDPITLTPFNPGFVGDGIGHLTGLPGWDVHPESQYESDNVGLLTGFRTLAGYADDRVGGILGVGRAIDHLVPMGDIEIVRHDDPFERDGHQRIPPTPSRVAADEFSSIEDAGPITGNVFDNDVLPNGMINFQVVPPPVGNLVIGPSGEFSYTPPLHFSGKTSFTYSFLDPATGETKSETVTIKVAAAADGITGSGGAITDEDAAVDVPIAIDLIDTDGSETLTSVVVSGVPSDATFGWDISLPGSVTDLGGGGFRFDGSFDEIRDLLASLSVTPGDDNDSDITLHVTATTEDHNPVADGGVAPGAATKVDEFDVVVKVMAVADTPTTAAPAAAFVTPEDTPVTISGAALADGLAASLDDTDGSETLTIEISDAPAGSSFTTLTGAPAGVLAAGIWSFTAAELAAGLQFVPPTNEHSPVGGWPMTMTATTTEAASGDQVAVKTAIASEPFVVIVEPVTDAPVVGATSSTVLEDSTVPFGADLDIQLADVDGSQDLSVELSGIPAWIALGWTDQPDVSVVVTVDLAGKQTITISGADPTTVLAVVGTLTGTITEHVDTDFTVGVAVSSTDASGLTETVTSSHPVTVEAVADAPSLSASASKIEDAGGDNTIAAPVITDLVDQDASEIIEYATVAGVPDYATPNWTLTGTAAATESAPGSGIWQVTGTTAEIRAALADLSFTLASHLDTDFELTVTVGTQEIDPLTEGHIDTERATTSITVPVVISAAADAPTAPAGSSTTPEDTAVTFGANIDYDLVDTDGSEAVSRVTIGNFPAGLDLDTGISYALSGDAEVTLAAGVYTITSTNPDRVQAAVDIRATLDSFKVEPIADSDVDFTLDVVVTTTDIDDVTGSVTTATTSTTHQVIIDAVADTPTIAGPTADITTDEDVPVAIPDLAGALVDTDGSETLRFEIADAPAGATFTDGSGGAVGTLIGAIWHFTAGEIAGGLTFVPPLNLSGRFEMTLTSFATETDEEAEITAGTAHGSEITTNNVASNATPFAIVVNALADGPDVSLAAATVTNEDTAVAFGQNIDYALRDGSDGSEHITSVTIADIPTDWVITVPPGLDATVTVDGSGNYVITSINADLAAAETEIRAALDALTILPPADRHEDGALTITVTTTDINGNTADTTISQSVTVQAVTDKPVANDASTTSPEDPAAAIAFGTDILVMPHDTDGSQDLSVSLAGIPSWITPAWTDVVGVTVTSTTVAGFTTLVIAGADAALVMQVVHSVTGTPTAHVDTDFEITVTATSTDLEGAATLSDVAFHQVIIEAIADAPTLAGSGAKIEDAGGNNTVSVPITTALVDADGSEIIEYATVAGVPAYATPVWTLTGTAAATETAPGSGIWQVTGTTAEIKAALASLKFTLPAHLDTDFDLTVTVGTQEIDPAGEGSIDTERASTTTTVSVVISAAADAPSAPAALSTTPEDTAVTFGANISYSLVDADGSEAIDRVTIGNFPAGLNLATNVSYTLSGDAAVSLAAGTYTITSTNPDRVQAAADIRATLNSFQLTPIADSDVDFTLNVSVRTTDIDDVTGTVTTATTNTTHQVIIDAVADTPTAEGPVAALTTNEDTPVAIPGLAGILADSDGSEVRSYEITGLPAGALLKDSLGNTIASAAGVWTPTQAQLDGGLNFTPPANVHSPAGGWTMTLKVIATETSENAEITGATNHVSEIAGNNIASATVDFTIHTTAVADPVTVSGSSSTNEDTAVNFGANFSYALQDTDGSESVTQIEVTNVPAGWTITIPPAIAAFVATDGTTWTITGTAAEIDTALDALTITPASNTHLNGSVLIKVTTTDINGDTEVTNHTHAITVTAVADVPSASANNASGNEDTWIPVSLGQGASADADGSETLTLRITGVATGAQFRTPDGAGGWTILSPVAGVVTVTAAQVTAGLEFLPPAQSHGTYNMTLIARSTETTLGGEQATDAGLNDYEEASAPFSITVSAVVDPPVVNDASSIRNEDQGAYALGSQLPISLADVDGSQDLKVSLTGFLADSTVSWTANAAVAVVYNAAAGTWEASGANAALVLAVTQSISVTTALHSDVNYAIGMTVETTDADGNTLSDTGTHTVTVRAIADAPTLSGSAAGPEDTAIPVTVTVGLVDQDGSETLQSVTITGIPIGATLAWTGLPAGATATPIMSGADIVGYTFAPADDSSSATADLQTFLSNNLTITPKLHSGDNITLAVSATTIESHPVGGEVQTLTATTNANVVIDVVPVADKPTAFVPGDYTITEDTPINLAGDMGGALVDTDGSETLTFKLTGVPEGATFVNGSGVIIATAGPTGIVTFTSAQMTAGFSFDPPFNAHTPPGGEWVLELTSYATEGENSSQAASDPKSFKIKIDAVADNPIISGSSTVNEDFAEIPVGADASIALYDTDGSEHITSITVSGLPADMLIQYTLSGDVTVDSTSVPGSYIFTSSNADLGVAQTQLQAVLDTVKLTPDVGFAAHSDANHQVTFAATTIDYDGITTGLTSFNHPIVVRAVADQPAATASAVGVEDTQFKIALGTDLVDTDGSETLSAVLTGIPTGWTVTVNGTTLTSGGSASLGAAVATMSGSEISFTAPTEAELDAILDQVYALAKEHQSGSFDMTFTATATEAASGGEVATKTADKAVNFTAEVEAVADLPTLKVYDATGASSGFEDTPLKLNFTATLTDKDGSETAWIEIKVPGHLAGGPPLGISFTNATGGAIGTLVSTDGLTGEQLWRFSPTENAVLHVLPAVDSNEDFTLSMRAIAIESNHPVGFPGKDDEAATAWQDLPVEIKGVADTPTLAVVPTLATEDVAIALGLAISGAINDSDIAAGRSQSETLSFIITGLPSGVIPTGATYIGNNTWQVPASGLAALTIPAPANFSGDYVATFAPGLTVFAVSQENDGNQTMTPLMLGAGAITVRPIADGFDGWAPGLTEHLEDSDIPLGGITFGGAMIDADSETIVSYTLDFNGLVEAAEITGVVTDSNSLIENFLIGLPAGANNGNGTITVTPAQLAGLSIDRSAFGDSNVDFSLPVSALVRDTAGLMIDERTETATFTVDLKGVADSPTAFAGDMTNNYADVDFSGATFDIIDVSTATQPFGGNSTDDDVALGRAPSESIYYIVSGIKDNPNLLMAFTDSSGNIVGLNNGDGTWYLSATDLADLNVRGRAFGTQGVLEELELTLTTVATENDGDVNTDSATFRIAIDPPGSGGGVIFPDPPVLIVGPMLAQEDRDQNLDGSTSGTELTDGKLTINIQAYPNPNDPPGTSVTVILSNLPAGIVVEGATFNPVTNQLFASAAALNAGLVKVTPPADFSGALTFDVEAVATNSYLNSTSSKDEPTNPTSGSMTFEASADGVTISASPAAAAEDQPFALNLNFALIDTTPDQNSANVETLGNVVRVTMPSGVTPSVGTEISSTGASKTYEMTRAEAAALQLTPPGDLHGPFSVMVEAASTEPANGNTKWSSQVLTFNVVAIGDAPLLTTINSSGDEDTPIMLGALGAALKDGDGSEILSVKISGIPVDTLLSAGSNNGDGSWTIPVGDLGTLMMLPPENYSGTMTLTLEAFGLETSNGSVGQATQDFTVTIAPLADKVSIVAVDVAGTEGADITLDLGLKLKDKSGSLPGENPPETLHVTFSGIPAGVSLVAAGGGTLSQLAGDWIFEGSKVQSKALAINSGQYSGDFTVTITAYAIDNGDIGNSKVDTFDVKIDPVADSANLVVNSAVGTAGSAIALNIFAGSLDTDGSETLAITLTGVPSDATLNNGVNNGDGSWSLMAADLDGLTITPAVGSSPFDIAVITQTTDTAVDHTDSSLTENAVLTVTIGSGNLAIAGNLLDNLLISGNGTDTLAGGDGNDTYVVNQSGDGIVEGIDGGTDLVQSSVTYTLAANVENLTLTGTGNIDGSGNGDGNTISGNDGDNSLTGGGGVDILSGGSGSDIFVWQAGDTGVAADHITDFTAVVGGDSIDISALLSTYDPLNDDIALFVQVVDDGSNSTINIDPTGSSSFSVSVVEIDGLTGVTLEQLRANNNLVA